MAKLLDVMSFPATGSYLIEASAGTGKTYTITSLYLRLILGHNEQQQAYRVEQILLVTFTEAATAELKSRVYGILQRAWQGFLQQSSDDAFIQQLIDECDYELSLKRLDLALKQLDEAAIFTIHGFCQRMLNGHAFESGSEFLQEFSTDDAPLLELAANDFWREKVYPLSKTTSEFIYQHLAKSPIKWLSKIKPYINNPYLQIQPNVQFSDQLVDEFSVRQKALVSQFVNFYKQENVADIFQQGIFKGNLKPGKAANQQALANFCETGEGTIDFAIWTPTSLSKALKKGQPELSLSFSSVAEQLAELAEQMAVEVEAAFIGFSLEQIRSRLSLIKKQQALILPDDLLNNLSSALSSELGNLLAERVLQQFPVAFIDEFQDTDPVQYHIFSKIYAGNENALWLMIGDPKQAIYGFRGADIFTYIQAKTEIHPDNHYSLDTNWRSQSQLVNAVNEMFESSQVGFLFRDEIPFMPVKAAAKADQQGLCSNGEPAANLIFRTIPEEVIKHEQARQLMAVDLANQISSMLDTHNNYKLGAKALQAGDICILVRNRIEAKLAKQTLSKANIASVFLSRESVFSSLMAQQLYRVLKALYQPHKDSFVRAALLTALLGKNTSDIYQYNQDETLWQQVMQVFAQGQALWISQGVVRAVQYLVGEFDGLTQLLKHQDSERLITDFRHLLELLQQQSMKFQGLQRLLNWYERALLDPDANNEGQLLRLESDQNLVKIMTMHGSKGLEFPVCFIPFACAGQKSKQAVYHHQQQLVMDVAKSEEAVETAEVERLAEDMRLLYVALTRAVNLCVIGMYNPSEGVSKSSNLANTAMGQLLLGPDVDKDCFSSFMNKLRAISQLSGVAVEDIELEQKLVSFNPDIEQTETLLVQELSKPISTDYRVTSFSGLTKSRHVYHEKSEQADDVQPAALPQQVTNQFEFPRGANAGSFLHGVLENWDFVSVDHLPELIEQQRLIFNMDEEHCNVVMPWMKKVVSSPLNKDTHFSLEMLSKSDFLPELEFLLPIEQLNANALNEAIRQYAPVSFKPLNFSDIKGMLKGFIDLIFCWQGKFYILDYKSNYLGDDYECYQQTALKQSMQDHDYFLQAWFYSLALHRYLHSVLPDYNYEQHFGGCYYLYLRGMDGSTQGQGVVHHKPDIALIEALDRTFMGEHIERAENQQLGLF